MSRVRYSAYLRLVPALVIHYSTYSTVVPDWAGLAWFGLAWEIPRWLIISNSSVGRSPVLLAAAVLCCPRLQYYTVLTTKPTGGDFTAGFRWFHMLSYPILSTVLFPIIAAQPHCSPSQFCDRPSFNCHCQLANVISKHKLERSTAGWKPLDKKIKYSGRISGTKEDDC